MTTLPLLVTPIIVIILVVFAQVARKETIATHTLIFGCIIVAFLLLNAWRAVHYVDHTYLLLAANRLEYHTKTVIIKTTWDNVRCFSQGFVTPALLLHKPAATYVTPFSRDIFIERRIPLHIFDYTSSSELAHDIHRFAPRLFTAKT